MNITLELTSDEVNAILGTLGNLPTSSGAWPLVQKIKQQGESQLETLENTDALASKEQTAQRAPENWINKA